MKNLKFYLIAIAILVVLSLALCRQYEHNKRVKAESESERLAADVMQLIGKDSNSVALVLRKDEINSKLSLKIDSLSKALKIRPKQIEKIITITNTIRDTVRVPVYIDRIGRDHWFLSDTMQCALYEADVYLYDQDLEIWRSNFENTNTTVQSFFKVRPKKFWFIKYGKWKHKQVITPKCGEVQINSIEFIK